MSNFISTTLHKALKTTMLIKKIVVVLLYAVFVVKICKNEIKENKAEIVFSGFKFTQFLKIGAHMKMFLYLMT